jgi:hypothetical protein
LSKGAGDDWRQRSVHELCCSLDRQTLLCDYNYRADSKSVAAASSAARRALCLRATPCSAPCALTVQGPAPYACTHQTPDLRRRPGQQPYRVYFAAWQRLAKCLGERTHPCLSTARQQTLCLAGGQPAGLAGGPPEPEPGRRPAGPPPLRPTFGSRSANVKFQFHPWPAGRQGRGGDMGYFHPPADSSSSWMTPTQPIMPSVVQR